METINGLNGLYFTIATKSLAYVNFLEKQKIELSNFIMLQRDKFDFEFVGHNYYFDEKEVEESRWITEMNNPHDPLLEDLKIEEYQKYLKDPVYGEMDFEDWDYVNQELEHMAENQDYGDWEEEDEDKGKTQADFPDYLDEIRNELPLLSSLDLILQNTDRKIFALNEKSKALFERKEAIPEREMALRKMKDDMFVERKVFLRKQFLYRKIYLYRMRKSILSFLKPSTNSELSNYKNEKHFIDEILVELGKECHIFLNDCFDYDSRIPSGKIFLLNFQCNMVIFYANTKKLKDAFKQLRVGLGRLTTKTKYFKVEITVVDGKAIFNIPGFQNLVMCRTEGTAKVTVSFLQLFDIVIREKRDELRFEIGERKPENWNNNNSCLFMLF